ncbi:hypothetical protein HK096_007603 [Nowakowskiella sp. JEL0078]|nr:hypothetical protein HK096_007603 [Nowakowskiella sp. JEL0078]
MKLTSWSIDISKTYPLNHTPENRDDWFGILTHIACYSSILLVFRFAFFRFAYEKQQTLIFQVSTPGQMNLPILENMQKQWSQNFLDCEFAKDQILRILKSIWLEFDPNFHFAEPQLMIWLMQVCLYLGLMTQCGNTILERNRAATEYQFMKNFMRGMGNASLGLSHLMVDELEKIDAKGWVNDPTESLSFFVFIDINKKVR